MRNMNRRIKKENLKEVAREVKEMMRDTRKNGVEMEVAVVWNKRNALSLLDTFSSSFLDRSEIKSIIIYNALDRVPTIKEIMDMIIEEG